MPVATSFHSGWLPWLRTELAPTHGRAAGALRTACAVVIASTILFYTQVPNIANGILIIFLLSYDVPYLTFRRGLYSLFAQTVGVVLALLLIIATDNDPMARVLGVGGFTFLAAFLVDTFVEPTFGLNIGIFSTMTLALWETHRNPSELVFLSFTNIIAGTVAIGVKILIEYAFTRRDPYRALQLEMKGRLRAAQSLFQLYADGAPAPQLARVAAQVQRYAFIGQAKMIALRGELRFRAPRQPQPNELPVFLAPLVARFVDYAAAFSRRVQTSPGPALQSCFADLAARIGLLCDGNTTLPPALTGCSYLPDDPGLADLSTNLEQMAAYCRQQDRELPLAPPPAPQPLRLFAADSFSNHAHAIHAFKLAFSAALCYILYNALGWPGIQTCTITVLITGLSSSGTSNQKMVLRMIGSFLGAVVLGLGCEIFLYPFAKTAMPFMVSLFVVSLLSAWIAKGSHIGYIGIQIAFSFFLVCFQSVYLPDTAKNEFGRAHYNAHLLTAPLTLTQGRDRVVGIFLALLVMWAIFHQFHSTRTIGSIRKAFAGLLRLESRQLLALRAGDHAADTALRDQIHPIAVNIRTISEAIPYEFDQHVDRDIAEAEHIQHAVETAGSIFLHLFELSDQEPDAVRFHPLFDHLSSSLARLADALDAADSTAAVWAPQPEETAFAALPHNSAQSALRAFLQLRSECRALVDEEIEDLTPLTTRPA